MTSNGKHLIQQVSSVSAVATKIGSTLWWSLPKTSVDRQTLKDTASNCGVPDRYLPTEITFISAFKRAIAAVKIPLEKNAILLRKLRDTPNELTYAIVTEQVTLSGKKVHHEQIGTVTADKVSESLRIVEDSAYSSYTSNEYKLVAQVSSTIGAAYTDAKLHNTNDIRSTITAFTNECGISLRESGGIYFIPLTHENTLNAIASFVKLVSPSAQVFIKPEYVMSDADLDALRRVTQSELGNEILKLEESFSSLQTEIDSMISSHERPGAKKQNQLLNQLSEYNSMRDRINTFAGTLNFTTDELSQKLNDLHKSLEHKLGKLRIKVKSDLRLNLDEDTNTNTVPDDWQPSYATAGPVISAPIQPSIPSNAKSTLNEIDKLFADLGI